MTDKIKMYCLVSGEALRAMKGNRGKAMAQAGHAYLHAFWDAQHRYPLTAGDYYRSERAYKIALIVPDADTLREFHETYRHICGVSLVEDAGLTVFDQPTITCLGIGPIRESQIGDDLKALKLLI